MSFGISPDRAKTFMVGADVAVAWIDKNTGKGYAEDYFLDSKSQCSGSRGSCPDTRLGVRNLHDNTHYAATKKLHILIIFYRTKLIQFVYLMLQLLMVTPSLHINDL